MRNSSNRPRSVRVREQPAYPEVSPHDYQPAESYSPGTSSSDTILVNAPSMRDFDRWRRRQQDPERYHYIYRVEQLRGLHDATILVVGGGNPQLLEPLKSPMYRCITLREVT